MHFEGPVTRNPSLNGALSQQNHHQTKLDMEQIIKQEKNVLLVLNELSTRLQSFNPRLDPESEIDLLMIADSLKESSMSVK